MEVNNSINFLQKIMKLLLELGFNCYFHKDKDGNNSNIDFVQKELNKLLNTTYGLCINIQCFSDIVPSEENISIVTTNYEWSISREGITIKTNTSNSYENAIYSAIAYIVSMSTKSLNNKTL